jgi:hypothetical protein
VDQAIQVEAEVETLVMQADPEEVEVAECTKQ